MTTTETTTETTTAATIETARAVRSRCEAAGLPAALVERAVRVGAHERHESRVRATLAAIEAGARALDGGVEAAEGGAVRLRLRAWAFGSGALAPEEDGSQLAALGRQLEVEVALAYLDLRGVGGRADAQGLATARMPWASGQRTWDSTTPGLGSGRFNANDGGAYRAAGQTALYRCIRARDRALGLGGASLPGVGSSIGICDVAGAPRPGWDAQAVVAVATAGHLFDPANDRWLEAALVRAAADPTVDMSALADAARLLSDERIERTIAAGAR